MSAIKVLIADDHTILREGIRSLLKMYDDIEVVGEAGDGQQAGNNENKGAHGNKSPGQRWGGSFGDGAGTVKVTGRAPRQVVAPRPGCYSIE